MGYLSGIYVRQEPSRLAELLCRCLSKRGCEVHLDDRPSPAADDLVHRISLLPWVEDWSRMQISHDDPGYGLILESIIEDPSSLEVVACRYEPDQHDYSYSCYRSGQLMEHFASGGPGMGSISFTSEIRTISLAKVLDAKGFMSRSMEEIGIRPRGGKGRKPEKIDIHFALPGRPSLFRRILAFLWQGDG